MEEIDKNVRRSLWIFFPPVSKIFDKIFRLLHFIFFCFFVLEKQTHKRVEREVAYFVLLYTFKKDIGLKD